MARRKSLAFLDVGQGDCFVADTKSGAIIFDGGSSSEDQVGRISDSSVYEISGVSEDSDCGDQSYGYRSLFWDQGIT